ncbi:LPS assembly lipoprotein LptE [Fulvimonas sp. R45]|uniref:LPS-assembly lipoprotein LptE n=1 Tax=Fulvimonas sp. R45 TaxID=3045937 RepID=UPI00265FF351|nr:LPS assembly lipoprotein LptE [Fulvimonas sp. R45]MDO1528082.1 LPS assembly lipoprotein LptE [Fulvimonas sp. R45]
MSRPLRVALLLSGMLALAACGFHLRRSAALPSSMQHVHLTVNGGGSLQRDLARTLVASGVVVEDQGGPGIAELAVPVASFSTDSLTFNGAARVTEYAVRYHVEFNVKDGGGALLVPSQQIDMSREYSYNAGDTVGSTAEVEQLQRSLTDDMVQAILFRLQAAAKHPQAVQGEAAPAAASTAR